MGTEGAARVFVTGHPGNHYTPNKWAILPTGTPLLVPD
jgi:hypothetical protein